MSRRTSGQPEIFSLSFLDLIFCAMAGILVLYSIADSDDSDDRPRKLPSLVEVEFDDDANGIALRLELETGTKTFVGSNDVPGGSWTFTTDPVAAQLRLDDGLAAR